MWKILPLKGKYYGTIIQNEDTEDVIAVWLSLSSGNYIASTRELESGWMPDFGFDHVETEESYQTALRIVETLNEISKTSN